MRILPSLSNSMKNLYTISLNQYWTQYDYSIEYWFYYLGWIIFNIIHFQSIFYFCFIWQWVRTFFRNEFIYWLNQVGKRRTRLFTFIEFIRLWSVLFSLVYWGERNNNDWPLVVLSPRVILWLSWLWNNPIVHLTRCTPRYSSREHRGTYTYPSP